MKLPNFKDPEQMREFAFDVFHEALEDGVADQLAWALYHHPDAENYVLGAYDGEYPFTIILVKKGGKLPPEDKLL